MCTKLVSTDYYEKDNAIEILEELLDFMNKVQENARMKEMTLK